MGRGAPDQRPVVATAHPEEGRVVPPELAQVDPREPKGLGDAELLEDWRTATRRLAQVAALQKELEGWHSAQGNRAEEVRAEMRQRRRRRRGEVEVATIKAKRPARATLEDVLEGRLELPGELPASDLTLFTATGRVVRIQAVEMVEPIPPDQRRWQWQTYQGTPETPRTVGTLRAKWAAGHGFLDRLTGSGRPDCSREFVRVETLKADVKEIMEWRSISRRVRPGEVHLDLAQVAEAVVRHQAAACGHLPREVAGVQ